MVKMSALKKLRAMLAKEEDSQHWYDIQNEGFGLIESALDEAEQRGYKRGLKDAAAIISSYGKQGAADE